MGVSRIPAYRNERMIIRDDSMVCARGLPDVFDMKTRPWVNVSGDEAQPIIATINSRPSGALHFERVQKDSSVSS